LAVVKALLLAAVSSMIGTTVLYLWWIWPQEVLRVTGGVIMAVTAYALAVALYRLNKVLEVRRR